MLKWHSGIRLTELTKSRTFFAVEKKKCFFRLLRKFQIHHSLTLREILFFKEAVSPIFSVTLNIEKTYLTGGDNSNKRCLSNTRSQLKSSRKFGSSSPILGIHSRMSRFFSALSRNYRVFPGKISKCRDSRRNLQIPGTILALSRNSVC